MHMSQSHLHAPWRLNYIRSLEAKEKPGPTGCFLCDAAGPNSPDQHRARQILWTSEHCVVLMNKFPYTTGHLLVAPKTHKPGLLDLSEDELIDVQRQTARAVKLISIVLNPQAYNVGMNLGRAAGAGVPGHLHQHIVPRWAGDANFMTVVGDVRVHPMTLAQCYAELLAAVDKV